MDSTRVVALAAEAAFGRPLVNNVQRSFLAEAMLSAALPASWRWCSGDWAPFDFQHEDGTRLEVKQSAARQTWHTADAVPSRGAFDIAPRKKLWQETGWVDAPGRNADLYVLAFNPIADCSADHRNPDQWVFYVLPTAALPATKSLSVNEARKLIDGVPIGCLATAVERERERFQSGPMIRYDTEIQLQSPRQ